MQNTKPVDYAWSADGEKLLNILKSGHQGLTENEAEQRLNIYGSNTFRKREKKSAFSILISQFVSPLIFILIAAGITTAVLQEWPETIVISLAVLINAVLGFYREYHAEHTLEKLSTFIKDRSRVIRNNRESEIDSEMLVPGDVIKISYGSRIPADARILSANNLRVDESILTGESIPVQKSIDSVPVSSTVAERLSMVHAGTLVVDGFATAVIVATSNETELGKIAGLVSDTRRAKTPIQTGLSKISWIIFAITIVIVVGIFVLGMVRGETFFDMLILSVAVAVGAVPESLPIALTVILSIGAERIAKKRGITRTLLAAETLGSTSLIMTDKTGTLTEANMRLVGIHTVKDLTRGVAETGSHIEQDHELLELALRNIDVLVENPDKKVEQWTFKGRPFEVNIVKTSRDQGIDISWLNKHKASSIIIPFSSTHKFSVSLKGHSYVIMGAPDVLLARSRIDSAEYKLIESWIEEASAEGKRLIAIAITDTPIHTISEAQNLTFTGVLAFHDPVRAEVPKAIHEIEALGIRIIMITGDLKGTAVSVARELGWKVSESQIIMGSDLQSISDEMLLERIQTVKIFARVTPEDKLRVGLLYRQLGEVVAMTGDGVNDAPALKAMDIGIALGSGSDVARSAADLVLLDDNFQTIGSSVQGGRRILMNIRKTFVYLMSNSLDEVFVVGGSLIVGIALPLSALQIIWVNLFTGSLPALAFAYDENFDQHIQKQQTLKSIFTREVNILTFGIGILSSLLLFVMYYGLIRFGIDVALARSIFFVCFASYILVISFSFRSLHKPLFSYPIFSNKRLNQSILIAAALLVVTMVIPAFRDFFDMTSIPPIWLLFVTGWLVLNVLLVEGVKYVFRK